MTFADTAPVCRAVAERDTVTGTPVRLGYRVEYVGIVNADAIDAGSSTSIYGPWARGVQRIWVKFPTAVPTLQVNR